MGEAVYTLKADFKTEAAAIEGAKKLDSFLQEVQKAYDFWQRNRGGVNSGMPKEAFWTAFRKDFPQVHKFLETLPGVVNGDHNNGLAGKMSFVEGRPGDKLDITVAESIVTYKAEVWHFAEWGPFVRFVKSEYGAAEAKANSDEYPEEDIK